MHEQFYEYQLETYDNHFNLVAVVATGLIHGSMPIVASCFFNHHLFFTPFDWRNSQVWTIYLIVGGLIALFVMLVATTWLPSPERFYFGQNGFRFEASFGSDTPSFYRPVNKVCRISFNPETGLRLTDSLGNRFAFSNVKYSLQSEQALKECFPDAFVAQDGMIDDDEHSAKIPTKHEIIFARVMCLMSVVSLCITVGKMIQSGQLGALPVFHALITVWFFALSWRFCRWRQPLNKAA